MSKKLTHERLREVLHYEPETGVFTWRMKRSAMAASGAVAGTLKRDGYTQIVIDYKTYPAHRLAWLYVFGEMPRRFIDHINGIRSDNRLSNLRDVSHQINLQNRRGAMRNSTSGVLGVSWRASAKHWRVSVVIDGTQREIGTFKCLEDARQASLDARRKHYGGFLL